MSFPCLVDIAESGHEAFDMCDKNTYDIIFMDIGLPDLKGYVVAKKLKKRDDFTKVSIIALSAHTDDDVRKKCQEVGIDDYLTKPLTDDKVGEVFRKFF